MKKQNARSTKCECPPRFTGTFCELMIVKTTNTTRNTTTTTTTTKIITCDSFPCQNGGTCIRKPNSFSCVCIPLYTGIECTTVVEFNLRYYFERIDSSFVTSLAPLESNHLAIGYNTGQLQIWNLINDDRQIFRTEGEVYMVTPLGEDYIANMLGMRTCQIWDIKKGVLYQSFTFRSEIYSLAYVGDNLLATGTNLAIDIWNLAEGYLNKTFLGHSSIVNSLVSLGNGLLASSGSWDKTVRVWNISTGKLRNTFDDTNGGHTDHVTSLAALGNGDLLASVSFDHSVKIWDIEKGALKYTFDNKTRGHTSIVDFVARVGDHFVASASSSLQIKLWDLRSGQLKHTFEDKWSTQRISSMTMLGNDLLVVGFFDGSMKIWDIRLVL